MSAIMIIDQAGLSSGSPGVAREDGLSDGSEVTLTSTNHVETFLFTLLWVGQHPDPDVDSVTTLDHPDGENFATFTPTPNVYGSWRIRLVTDPGTPFESEQIRIFAIKFSPEEIRIPAANERSSDAANLTNIGAHVGTSEFNAPENTGGPFDSGTAISHWRPLADLIYAWNQGGGGGGPEFGDDLSGVEGATLVTGFYGRPLLEGAPNNGDVYVWDGENSVWELVPMGGGGGIGFGGDLEDNGGGFAAVIGLRSTPISLTSPSDGQVLVYVAGEYTPVLVPAYGADLVDNGSGQARVQALQGNGIADVGVPNIGDFLYWDGGSWTPFPMFGGDISDAGPRVIALQGNPVADSGAPNEGDVLTWSGGQWVPMAPIIGP